MSKPSGRAKGDTSPVSITFKAEADLHDALLREIARVNLKRKSGDPTVTLSSWLRGLVIKALS